MFQYVVCGELKKIAKTSHLYTFTKWKTSTQRRFLEEGLPSEDVLGRWKLLIDLFIENEWISLDVYACEYHFVLKQINS